MIKKNLKTLIVTSILIVLPVLAGIILWDRLPEQMPTHWNAAGDIDGWTSKPFTVFGLPLILLAAQWLCVLGTLADPKKENHPTKILHLVLWIIPVITIPLCLLSYGTVMGMAVSVELVVPMLVGLIFVILGNYMPKCRQNYTIGYKIPWTLNSEENWNKTHRLAGKLMVAAGFLLIASSLLGFAFIALFVAIALTLVPVIYSYLLYRKNQK